MSPVKEQIEFYLPYKGKVWLYLSIVPHLYPVDKQKRIRASAFLVECRTGKSICAEAGQGPKFLFNSIISTDFIWWFPGPIPYWRKMFPNPIKRLSWASKLKREKKTNLKTVFPKGKDFLGNSIYQFRYILVYLNTDTFCKNNVALGWPKRETTVW